MAGPIQRDMSSKTSLVTNQNKTLPNTPKALSSGQKNKVQDAIVQNGELSANNIQIPKKIPNKVTTNLVNIKLIDRIRLFFGFEKTIIRESLTTPVDLNRLLLTTAGKEALKTCAERRFFTESYNFFEGMLALEKLCTSGATDESIRKAFNKLKESHAPEGSEPVNLDSKCANLWGYDLDSPINRAALMENVTPAFNSIKDLLTTTFKEAGDSHAEFNTLVKTYLQPFQKS